jgi:hypothetical protein
MSYASAVPHRQTRLRLVTPQRARRPPTAAQLVRGLGTAVVRLDLWKLTAVFCAKACAAYSLIFWTPLVIADLLHGAPEDTPHAAAANPNLPILLTAVPYAFAAAATYAIGWSSQRARERRIHTALPFALGSAVLLAAPALSRGSGALGKLLSFAALCIALSSTNGTGPLTALVMAVLPPEAQSAGVALWNSGANVGGYVGPALFGWLKARTGTHAAGMVVRDAAHCVVLLHLSCLRFLLC